MMIAVLVLLPTEYPRVLYGAACAGNAKGSDSAVFDRKGFGDRIVELSYREVTGTSWSDSGTSDGMSLTTEGDSKDGTTTLHVKGHVSAAHYSNLLGTWALKFVRPLGTVRSHLDVSMSGTVTARGVNKKFPNFYAESRFWDLIAHADSNTPNSMVQIDRHWTVERREENEWHEVPERSSQSPFATSADPWADQVGKQQRLLTDIVFLPQALLVNNTTASSYPPAGCSGEGDCDVTITVKASVEVAPALDSRFELANYVGEDGKCEFGFRDAYFNRYSKNQDGNGLWFSGNAESGAHSYLAIHSLGKSKLSAEQVMNVCKTNIGTIFPGGSADISAPKMKTEVVNGHRYKLLSRTLSEALLHPGVGAIASEAMLTGELPPIVDCIESNSLHFTFEAEPQHILVGTALHGVFKDSTGELWLYQQGRGVAVEKYPKLAYLAAHNIGMWSEMASNLRRAIGN